MGRSRGRVQGVRMHLPPPEMKLYFFLVFAFKICLPHWSVTSVLRDAPPPKENPGSSPEMIGFGAFAAPSSTEPKKI